MPPVLLAALPVLHELLRLVNAILEGIPVEQRRAEAVKWFWLTWPSAKVLLRWAGAPPDAVQHIETLMKGQGV